MPDKYDSGDFWDLSGSVKKTVHSSVSRPFDDLSGKLVTSGESACETGEKLDRAKPSPVQSESPAKESVGIVYENVGLIRSVRLIPWQSGFLFYSHFRTNAQRYHFMTSGECAPEHFFSYMPQYEQLTQSQSEYYLFWRSQVRRGIYPPVESSYIFLYLYEIINLPDLIPPSEGVALFCGLWRAYREKYRYLDKYIGEWLCDYCLINRISPPSLSDFLGEALSKLALPEFYINPAKDGCPFELIASLSPYDYKKSRFYTQHCAEWDIHIPASTVLAANAMISDSALSSAFCESHIVRDSFSGAVAYVGVKYKIEITFLSLRRSREFHQYVALAEKAAENELRAEFDIKSRFSVAELPKTAADAIALYFDGVYPSRRVKKKKTDDADEASYMKYYEPKNKGEADISRALDIEREAWKTVEVLTPSFFVKKEGKETSVNTSDLLSDNAESKEDKETSVNAPDLLSDNAEYKEAEETSVNASDLLSDGAEYKEDGEISVNAPDSLSDNAGSDLEKLIGALGQTLRLALYAALCGDFPEYCRKNRLFPDDAVRQINELSYGIIGDMIVGEDYSVIEEYRADVILAFGEETDSVEDKNG